MAQRCLPIREAADLARVEALQDEVVAVLLVEVEVVVVSPLLQPSFCKRLAPCLSPKVTNNSSLSHGDRETALPDPNVKRVEDEIEKNVLKSSSSDPALPTRPAYGTLGKPVVLFSNYMQLTSSGNLLLHRYAIDISKDQVTGRDAKAKDKQRIIQLLLQDNFPNVGPGVVSDFKANLIAAGPLQVSPNGYTVVFRAEDEDVPGPNARRYRVRLLLAATFTVSNLINYLTSSDAGSMISTMNKGDIIQALNIIIGHNPKANPHIASLGASRHHDWNASPLGAHQSRHWSPGDSRLLSLSPRRYKSLTLERAGEARTVL